jgi:F-type H+-transporting ATPase subunit alpha
MTLPHKSLQVILKDAFDELRSGREGYVAALAPREVGTVTTVSTGIAMVAGLPNVVLYVMVIFY